MHLNRNRPTAIVAAMTLMSAVTACSASGEHAGPPAAPPSAAGAQPTFAVNDDLSWADGRSHLIVTTAVNAGTTGSDVDMVVAAVSGADTATRADPPRSVGSRSGPTTVRRADGTIATVLIPPESLTVILARDAADRAALDAGGNAALLVVDDRGVAGPVGSVYVLNADELVEVRPAVASSPGSGDGNGDTDEVIAGRIAAVAGVVSARRVGPGIIDVVAEPTDTAVTAEIAGIAGVTAVSADSVLGYVDDPGQANQWAIENTGAPDQAGGWPGVIGADTAAIDAWTVTDGAGITVAVIDSGVELSHPDLASQIWTNPGETCGNSIDDDHNGFVDDCHGWDFGGADGDPNPDRGAAGAEHGTHVAGIVAAAANGVGTVGIAPGATIMPLKVANPAGGISGSAVAAAVDYARANGARVINMSIATAPNATRASIAAIENAITAATNAGVVVVAGAGNNNLDLTTINVWPASLSMFNTGVITAGASTNSDTRASFSNFGTAVSMYAPGWWIMSTVLDGRWNHLSGTSMATPYVAGGAALVLASGRAATPAAVRTLLVDTAHDTAAGKRLDVAAAVGAQRGAEVAPLVGVTYSGTSSIVADTDGTLTATITAGMSSGITQMRLSVAANDEAGIAAVEGLEADFADAAGHLAAVVTGEQGDFPVVPLRDADGLHGPGAAVDIRLSLPAGEYAFVTEMLDAAGDTVGGAQVAYIAVSPVAGDSTGGGPATTVPGTPVTTRAPEPGGGVTTAQPGAGAVSGTTPAPADTVPATSGGTPATTAPAGSPTVTSPAESPATTVPTGGPGTAVPVTTPGGAPATTPGAGTGATTTVAGTLAPTPATTVAPALTSPATTVPGTQPPVVTTPASTTPRPIADFDGRWSVTSMAPRIAPICGGIDVSLDGRFPTTVPVYVWFGADGPVVPAEATSERLVVHVPAVLSAKVVDVTVKFRTDQEFALTLERAFTYADVPTGCSPAASSTTTPPGMTTPAGPPATTAPGGTTPPGGGATTTTTTTTSPPTGSTGGGPAALRSRGPLTLRTIAPGGVLSGLSTTAWPAQACRHSTCPATNL